MTEKKCYEILELQKGATFIDIKKAYRSLAFALHPDLNPNLPNANIRFQQLNSAYVFLMDIYEKKRNIVETEEEKTAKAQAAQEERERKKAERAYAKVKKEEAKQQAKEQEAFKASQTATTSASHQKAQKNDTAYRSPQNDKKFDEQHKKRETVINSLLSDPFAKRVFEDIYNRIQEIARDKILRPDVETVSSSKDIYKKNASNERFSTKAKRWFARLIDDEQVLKLPLEKIMPGARIRMEIQHGIHLDAQTIEVTLPLEFTVGKVLRLRGMGKRIGSFSGDLYVRIEAM